MGAEVIFLASLAVSAFQAVTEISSANDAEKAAAAQANAEIQELGRQQEEQNRISQEQRSDRVRAADQQFASLTASLSESGGAGTSNEDRLGQEVDFLAGLDLARIEGNRRSSSESQQASKRASRARFDTAANQANARRTGAVVNFLGSAASSGQSFSAAR